MSIEKSKEALSQFYDEHLQVREHEKAKYVLWSQADARRASWHV